MWLIVSFDNSVKVFLFYYICHFDDVIFNWLEQFIRLRIDSKLLSNEAKVIVAL